jgi:hypothetical protein
MPSRRRRLAGAAIIAAAAIVFASQAVADRAILGIAVVPFLAVPGILLGEALGASTRPWAERILIDIVWLIAVAVLAGIVTALSPRGISASSVAAVELAVLALAAVAWLRRRSAARRRRRRGRALTAWTARWRDARLDGRMDTRIEVRSVAIVLLGVFLGAAGFAIATRSAEAQNVAEVVQFWSVPGADGHTVLGVANDSTYALDCTITFIRPQFQPEAVRLGTLAPGQQWHGQPAPAEPAETAPWRLVLGCVTSSGEHVQRTLTIAPPH